MSAPMKTTILLAAVACAAVPLAAFAGPVYFTGSTCGSNSVTELQAGAFNLPGDDISVTVPGGRIAVQPQAGYDVAIVLCDDVSPLSRCENIVDERGEGAPEYVNLPSGSHTLRIDSAAGIGAGPFCGNVTVYDMTLGR